MVAPVTTPTSRFPLGRICATPGALDALQEAIQIGSEFLARHQTGNWGEVCAEDGNANEQAIKDGERILSAYLLKTGVKILIITEADRSVTTILLPDEY